MPPVDQAPENEIAPDLYLSERLLWLVRLRWIAIAGIVVTVLLSAAVGVLRQPLLLLAVAGLMGAYNTAFWRWLRTNSNDGETRLLQRMVFFQVLLDLLSLTVLLHLAGGVENPFVAFFAFHVAIGAMLLPLQMALYLGVAASCFHGLSILGEFSRLLEHHPLDLGLSSTDVELWQLPSFVLGYLVAFVLMLFGVIYFVQSIAARHRHAEEVRLEREQIAQSRERLARIGEISAGVAHTLRNPLHGLLNCVDILHSRVAPEDPIRETLALMSEGLHRIEQVTRRLLVLTREAPLEKVNTNVNSLIREALSFIEVRSREKGLKIGTQFGELPRLEIDPHRISEALLNVLDNALDACTNEGSISVRTSFNDFDQWIRIEVEDSGEGILPQNLSRVFDPFFTTKPTGQGSGLGLAIAQRIVQEHGGSVALESHLGKGTRVTFLLPRPLQRAREKESP